jgi:hypothetical protein
VKAAFRKESFGTRYANSLARVNGGAGFDLLVSVAALVIVLPPATTD